MMQITDLNQSKEINQRSYITWQGSTSAGDNKDVSGQRNEVKHAGGYQESVNNFSFIFFMGVFNIQVHLSFHPLTLHQTKATVMPSRMLK
jgi:hypothetical protein